MNKFITIKKLFLSCIMSLFICHNAIANIEWRYNHDKEIYAANKDWMKKLHDLKKINHLSIPGTHNSASMHGSDIVQNQSLTIAQQLEAGIRFFDLRLMQKESTLHFYHGPVNQYQTFDEALAVITQFLTDNPSEAVIMRVKEERKPMNPTTHFSNLMLDHVKENINFFLKKNLNLYELTVGDIRGKIILLKDFSIPTSNYYHEISKYSYSYIYNQFQVITDDWHLNTNWDLYGKWEKIKKVITRANATQHSFDGTEMENTYITYLSGNGGSFPYFVASGKSSHGNNDPQLLTGLTTPGWKDTWPDFPRVSCWGSLCSIAFWGTNMLVSDYIDKNNPTSIGWIVTDFPGPKLIKSIIDLNYKPVTRYNIDGYHEMKKLSNIKHFTKIMDFADIVQIKVSEHGYIASNNLFLPKAYQVTTKNKRIVVKNTTKLSKLNVYFPNKMVTLKPGQSDAYTYKWTDTYKITQQYELEKLQVKYPKYLKSFFHKYPSITKINVTTTDGNWVKTIQIPTNFMKGRQITVKVNSTWNVQVIQGQEKMTLSRGQSHTFYPKEEVEEDNTEPSNTYTINKQMEINKLGNPNYIKDLFSNYKHIIIITSNGNWRNKIILPTYYNNKRKVTVIVNSSWSVRVEKGNERRQLRKGQSHVYTYSQKSKTYACHYLVTTGHRQSWVMIPGYNETSCKAKNQCSRKGKCYSWKKVTISTR